MTCTSRISAAVLLALPLASTPLLSQRTRPLAEAQLRVQIESARYERRLGPQLSQLRKIVHDSLQAILADRFPFIRWNATTGSNVLDITFRGSEGREQYLYLDVSAHAPNMDTVTTRFEFENEVNAHARRQWTLNHVSAEWIRTLKQLISEKEQSIVAAVGGLPLRADVALRPGELRAILGLNSQGLSASPRSPLVFRVQVAYREQERATRGIAELIVNDCRDTVNNRYSCTIDAVTFNGETEPVEAHLSWLKNSELNPLTLHVFEYSKRQSGGVIVMVRSGGAR